MKILSCLLVNVVLVLSNDCIWKDSLGHSYDFGQMDKPGGWQVRDMSNGMGMFNMVYMFNFCNPVDLRCEDKPVLAYEALEVMGTITENCDVVGLPTNRALSHINDDDPEQGVQLKVDDGDECLELLDDNTVGPASTRVGIFKIWCPADGVSQENFAIVQGQGCTTIMEIYHTFGCYETPGKLTSTRLGKLGFKHLMFTLLLIAVLYFGVRYYINTKQRGLEGYEAVPHIEAFRSLSIMVFAGLKALSIKAISGLSRITQRGGYDSV